MRIPIMRSYIACFFAICDIQRRKSKIRSLTFIAYCFLPTISKDEGYKRYGDNYILNEEENLSPDRGVFTHSDRLLIDP